MSVDDDGKLHKKGLRSLHSMAMSPLFACSITQCPVFVDELDQYGEQRLSSESVHGVISDHLNL